MQIFVLDLNPQESAKFLCNKHLPKMALESTQLLSNAIPIEFAPYKRSYLKHPCALWVLESKENFLWLVDHGLAICKEYTYRYNRTHACEPIIERISGMAHKGVWKRQEATPFVQCIPSQYKVENNPVEAYRAYYNNDKSRFAKWTKREVPFWWNPINKQ